MSCSKKEPKIKEVENNSNTIYAAEAPYYFTATSNCSNNRIDLQSLIDIAAANNKRLVIEKDVYCIDGSLNIPSNIEIDFSGSTIVRETNTNPILVFDMIVNKTPSIGNKHITLKNLIIDGQYQIDNLSNNTDAQGSGGDLFSGLKLENCTQSKLENITVKNTVNAEEDVDTPAAGIFITDCSYIECNKINGYYNLGTAIIVYESNNITIHESKTENNLGTGLSTILSDFCSLYNLTSHNNGHFQYTTSQGQIEERVYSNISINGKYSQINGVITSNASGSGLNIGHPANPTYLNGTPADFTIIDNVFSFHNSIEGITIRNTNDLLLSNIHVQENFRNNLLISNNSSRIKINNIISNGYYVDNVLSKGVQRNSNQYGHGISILGGGGHSINNASIYNNYKSGIYIENVNGGASINGGSQIFNNGKLLADNVNEIKSGIHIVNSYFCRINAAKIYDDQSTSNKTQDYGIYVSGGGNNKTIYSDIFWNIINDIQGPIDIIN
ncbi:hypothetical protein KFE94_05390 [bacterium SCSIO 12643]|nr:hypothetical protein KFE94_05390 [bacterium SCSIO 12643]